MSLSIHQLGLGHAALTKHPKLSVAGNSEDFTVTRAPFGVVCGSAVRGLHFGISKHLLAEMLLVSR